MWVSAPSRLRSIDLRAETGGELEPVQAPGSRVDLETSTMRMALLCSARQFGHRLGEWHYEKSGDVSACCAGCHAVAALHVGGAGDIRVERDIRFRCEVPRSGQPIAG